MLLQKSHKAAVEAQSLSQNTIIKNYQSPPTHLRKLVAIPACLVSDHLRSCTHSSERSLNVVMPGFHKFTHTTNLQ